MDLQIVEVNATAEIVHLTLRVIKLRTILSDRHGNCHCMTHIVTDAHRPCRQSKFF